MAIRRIISRILKHSTSFKISQFVIMYTRQYLNFEWRKTNKSVYIYVSVYVSLPHNCPPFMIKQDSAGCAVCSTGGSGDMLYL